jgi:hypothetical protein
MSEFIIDTGKTRKEPIECACYDGAFSVTKGWLPSGIPPEEDNGWVDK